MLLAVCETQISARAQSAKTSATPDHYLLLVNTAMAGQMNAQKLMQFDRSPYDGLAVSFSDAYDVSPVPTLASIESQLASWKKYTSKQIWPWIYVNRMVGANGMEGNELTKVPYFQKFQGLDLDGKAGAQDDFLENWRNGLRAARDSGVPGIVFDLEFIHRLHAPGLQNYRWAALLSRRDIHCRRHAGPDSAAETFASSFGRR